MANVFDYVEKYGDLTFRQKRFNEVDNLIFSALAYVDLRDTKVDRKICTLAEVGREYLETHNDAEMRKYYGLGMYDAHKLLKKLIDKPRYANLRILDYDYNVNSEMQFGAVVFELLPDLIYVSFEGTDQLIVGWKEDADLSYMFPVPAQVEAVEFLNRNIKTIGPDVIVGGHSKGGNLALVSSMFMSYWKKRKILRIYNNDGPGLRRKEFESARYRSIKDKYVHIVPDSSVVGMLLRHDKYKVVKSMKSAPISHEISSWEIIDSKLRRGALSPRSVALEKSVLNWLDTHDDKERKKVCDAIFGTLRKSGLLETYQLKNPRILLRAINKFGKEVDDESKQLALELIKGTFDGVLKAK